MLRHGEDKGPIHPDYPEFRLRRCRHFSDHQRRDSHSIDVLSQRSVMAAAHNSSYINRYADRGLPTIWEANSPDRLVDLATRCILANPRAIFRISKEKKKSAEDDGLLLLDRRNTSDFTELHEGIILPTDICEKLLQTMHSEGLDLDDRVAKAFGDVTCARFMRISLRGSSITDEGLACLLRHNLRELDIHNCRHLTRASLDHLNAHMKQMVALTIGDSTEVLPSYAVDFFNEGWSDDDEDEMDEYDRQAAGRCYILDAPELLRLCIRDLHVHRGLRYFDLLLGNLKSLTHLDLSGAKHREGFGKFEWLLSCQVNLVSLVLHNVDEIDHSAVMNISKMTRLRHLDISQNNEKQGIYEMANVTLRTLVESLPHLASLDISGTNLAGNGVYELEQWRLESCDGKEEVSSSQTRTFSKCDIPGLVSRVDRPLGFLGLYRTHYEACCRAHIPAKEVSGDSTEPQILAAGRHYLDRPLVLENVLNDLFHIFRYDNCADLVSALDIILLAMERHPHEKVIQISGSASLYYVVKSEIRLNLNVKVKQKILATLLNGMFAHKHDAVMMRNGCLTLCQFTIPQDVIFDYERLVRLLLFIVSEHNGEVGSFVQRAGICLLNTLACQVDGQQKLLVGNLGAMEKMLDLIKDRVQSGNCDDVMETAWSAMWNVTDETPINCRRFLDGGGMQLFLRCKEKFPEKQDLLRNMMGLLGNVAEVPELRSQLMTTAFVAEFSMLLDSTSDGIEVSYNAAGVLAHMASDGEEAWCIDDPTRLDVLNRMVSAIERWDINTKRNINYRSFEPILRLVRVSHTPQCQHWAVWALANLTRVDQKYCSLIEEEGGLGLLEELINSNSPPVPYERVLDLAAIVRENVANWKERGHKVVAIDEALDFDG